MSNDSLIDSFLRLKQNALAGPQYYAAIDDCIAIIMGDASTRKDEAACASSPTISDSPDISSEIRDIEHRLHSMSDDATGKHHQGINDSFNALRPYLNEPILTMRQTVNARARISTQCQSREATESSVEQVKALPPAPYTEQPVELCNGVRLCPCCKGEAICQMHSQTLAQNQMFGLRYSVHCIVCGAIGSPKKSKEDAIAAWNTRPTERESTQPIRLSRREFGEKMSALILETTPRIGQYETIIHRLTRYIDCAYEVYLEVPKRVSGEGKAIGIISGIKDADILGGVYDFAEYVITRRDGQQLKGWLGEISETYQSNEIEGDK